MALTFFRHYLIYVRVAFAATHPCSPLPFPPPTCLFKYRIIPRLVTPIMVIKWLGGTITLTQNTTSWQSMNIRKLFTSAVDATLRRMFDIIVLVRGSHNDGAMKVSAKVENFNVAFVKP